MRSQGSTLDQSIGERQELVDRENVNINVGTGLAPVLTPTPAPTYSIMTQVQKQSLPLQWLCLAALGVGEIINLILRSALYTQTFNTSGIDPAVIRELIFDTTYGHLWLARIALIVLALTFLAWTNRSSRSDASRVRNSASTRKGERQVLLS